MGTRQNNTASGWTVKKIVLMGTGWALLVIGPVVGLLPGPGGFPIVATGMILILSQSYTAKRIFIQQRYPRILGPLRRFIRRKRPAPDSSTDKQPHQ
jgi:hypothetical protein